MSGPLNATPSSPDADALSIGALGRGAWADFRRTWPSLIGFEVAFKLAAAFVLVPGSAWLLARVIAVSGRSAVNNTDIVRFVLSVPGLVTAALIGVGLLGGLLLEHTGVLAVAALQLSGRKLTPRRMASATTFSAVRVLRLGLAQIGAIALVAAPFAILAGATYFAFLSRNDINYYLSNKPPAYYAAVGVGAVLVLMALALGVRIGVGWSLALPILLFEHRPPRDALRTSRQRVRGAGWRIGAVLIGWHVVAVIVGAVLLWGFHRLAAALLDRAGDRATAILPLTAGLLAIHAFITAAASFFSVVGHCMLTMRIYRARGGVQAIATDDEAEWTAPSPWKRRIFALGAVGIVAIGLAFCVTLPEQIEIADPIEITGHRGYETVAPENTLSSFRAAADAGADWIELDVQLSKDGAIVVLHDRDFRRVCGVARRPGQLTLTEIKELDASMPGRFGSTYAGERIATLKEVVDAMRGKVKINIELKVYAGDRRIAAAVADFVRAERLESDCLIASLDYQALLDVRAQNPGITTAAIVAATIGDIGRLEVDVLSVSRSLATNELLREARRQNKRVLVWTVNDPRAMTDLIERGAGRIITNEPALLARVRSSRASLGPADRMLIAARHLLGLHDEVEPTPEVDSRP